MCDRRKRFRRRKKTRHIAAISTVMEKRANVHRFMYCMSFSLITFSLFGCYALGCFFLFIDKIVERQRLLVLFRYTINGCSVGKKIIYKMNEIFVEKCKYFFWMLISGSCHLFQLSVVMFFRKISGKYYRNFNSNSTQEALAKMLLNEILQGIMSV